MNKYINQSGYLPEMEGMEKVWDRNDYQGIVTGDRFHYKTKITGKCSYCGEPTNNVTDYLGSLSFVCGFWCVYGMKKEDFDHLPNSSPNKTETISK